MLLTDEQKSIFIRYLLQNIDSSEKIINQMEKAKIPECLIAHEKQKNAAFFVVANHLDNTETINLG
jgi:hypothetical protein